MKGNRLKLMTQAKVQRQPKRQKRFILAPSLLSADFGNLNNTLERIEKVGCKWVHIDVMDGHFVPNITLGPDLIKSLRRKSKLFFDVHLMIEDPLKYAQAFVDAGANQICFHREIYNRNLKRITLMIKSIAKKVAISVKPETPIDSLINVLPVVDMVLIMTVEPGFGGQKLLTPTINKVRELSLMREEMDLDFLIAVDGGINEKNILCVYTAGADVIVAGSSVFEKDKIEENIKKLYESVNKQILYK